VTRSIYGTTECGTPIHILQSSGLYIAQVRRMGYQKYETVGRARTLQNAISKAAKSMNGRHRLRVVFQDSSPYYEPHIVFEGIRK
jgi:hypothetical protein